MYHSLVVRAGPGGRALAGLLWLSSIATVEAQQPAGALATITGRVLAEAGSAVSDAVVVLDSVRRTRTDPNGLFRFDSLARGVHRLEVRAIGFSPLAAKVELFGGAADAVVTLKALAQPLPEISVTGRRRHLLNVGYYRRKASERGVFSRPTRWPGWIP